MCFKLRTFLALHGIARGDLHPELFSSEDIELGTGVNVFSSLTSVLGYKAGKPPFRSLLELQ